MTMMFFMFDFGLVPDEIADQGPAAVRKYAKGKLDALVAEEKKRRADYRKRVDHPERKLEIDYNGVLLRGFVTKGYDKGARDRTLKIVMTDPLKLEAFVHIRPSCWAEAMGGGRTFDEDGKFTAEERDRQDAFLQQMYADERERRDKPPAHPTLSKLSRNRFRFGDEDKD